MVALEAAVRNTGEDPRTKLETGSHAPRRDAASRAASRTIFQPPANVSQTLQLERYPLLTRGRLGRASERSVNIGPEVAPV